MWLVGLLAAVACAPLDRDDADTGPGDTATAGDGQVVLTDRDMVHLYVSLRLAAQAVVPERDLEVRWDGLATTDLGVDLADQGPVSSVQLWQFPDHDAGSLAEALSAGTVEQREVAVALSCEPSFESCHSEDFVFQAGHPYDLVAAMTAGSGAWLLSLLQGEEPVPAARLVLDPRSEAVTQLVQVTDLSSDFEVAVEGATGLLPVPDRDDLEVDWSGLVRSSLGGDLDPASVERVVLARVPSGTAVDVLALRLVHEADLAWAADVYGRTSVTLSELGPLDHDAPFSGFDAAGPDGLWVLALYGDSAALLPLAALVPLAPG